MRRAAGADLDALDLDGVGQHGGEKEVRGLRNHPSMFYASV